MREGEGRLAGIAWRTKPREAMIEAQDARVTLESGVENDFRGAPGERQVTILFAADWEAACALLGARRPWTLRRANLLLEGVQNPCAAGRRIRIGDAAFAITGETDPCSVMEKQWPGLRAALAPDWRGGVTTRVVRAGAIRVGDAVEWVD
ncbi:MAG: MOSC domain-containing protein [Alphaproteobacteria bacterium]|nr:MOSC domain-containing protein [Alphaproteobacteria bacterium]